MRTIAFCEYKVQFSLDKSNKELSLYNRVTSRYKKKIVFLYIFCFVLKIECIMGSRQTPVVNLLIIGDLISIKRSNSNIINVLTLHTRKSQTITKVNLF